MFRKAVIAITVVSLVGTILAGCAQPTPTPKPAPTEAAEPAKGPATAAPQPATPTVAATAAPQPTAALAKKMKVAFLFSGVVNDGAYNSLGYNAMNTAQKELGFDMVWNEQIAPADGARVMGEFASSGVDAIWGHTGQYLEPMRTVAADFPQISFITYPSDPIPDPPPNLWQDINAQGIREMFYMAGVMAGLMTKSNVIGFVGGVEIKVYADGAVTYEQGAKSVNPDVKLLKVFTGSWEDAAKAKEAAIGQMEQGADVFFHAMNQGVYGLGEAVETKPGVYMIGKDLDQSAVAPDRVLCSVFVDYERAMEDIIPSISRGQLGGIYNCTLSNGAVTITEPASFVPADVAAKFKEIKDKIIKGEIKP